MPSGSIVPDHEYVYRRIPWAHFSNPRVPGAVPMMLAFRPTPSDETGLSVSVASLTSIEHVARGRGDAYHVGRLQVGVIRETLALTVRHDPLPGNAAHAVIPELSHAAYLANKTSMKAKINALVADHLELVLVHLGPVG